MSARPLMKRLVAVTAGGLTMALMIASPAMADTSQSAASAIELTLVGGSVVNSGTVTASNDGTTETQTGNTTPPLSILGSQNVITAGALVQTARAFADGTSAACAGVLGNGGSITVGNNGDCTVTPGASVTLTLGNILGIGSIALQADAIYASCTADSTPSATGTATLTNARITATLLGITTTLLSLNAAPAPNSGINIPGVLSAVLNAQGSPTTGEIAVNAISITALSGTLASLSIGRVTCGPNAEAPPVPSIPLKGWPVALGMAAIISGGFLLHRRLRPTV